jgi:hypothetical protein
VINDRGDENDATMLRVAVSKGWMVDKWDVAAKSANRRIFFHWPYTHPKPDQDPGDECHRWELVYA